MTFSISTMAIDTFVPFLRTLSNLLDKGAEHLRGQGKDPETLVNAKLAPDMFPLVKQVQIACDHAKGAAARLTGREPPRFEDNEQTLDQLKSRIKRTLEYVESVPATAYKGADQSSNRISTDRRPRARCDRHPVPERLGVSEFLFPRGNGLRHPAPSGRADRQARLPRARRLRDSPEGQEVSSAVTAESQTPAPETRTRSPPSATSQR